MGGEAAGSGVQAGMGCKHYHQVSRCCGQMTSTPSPPKWGEYPLPTLWLFRGRVDGGCHHKGSARAGGGPA